LLEQRDGALRDHEGSGQVDVDHGLPGVERIVGDRRRGAGNAGVVDEHVQPAQSLPHVGKQRVQVGRLADIADAAGDAGERAGDVGDGLGVDVGDMDARAAGREGLGNGQADAACTGRDEDMLGHDLMLRK
jgi:hypothetical protein